MGENPPLECKITIYSYGPGCELLSGEEMAAGPFRESERQRVAVAAAEPPPFRCEHDPAGRVFRLSVPDGTVAVFRDTPARYLGVEPYLESGEM